MAEDEKRNRWLFTKEQLANSPSRAHGVDATKELSYRQQTANFIQDMGRRLGLSQLVINTAIVYMHRFFMHHSFKVYHRNNIAAAFLFLACKVEEQPRKLEHVVTVAYGCLHRGEPMIDTSSEEYKRLTNEVIKNELLILQTLGFDVQIRHPHPDVVKCTQLVRASKDLAQTAYFMAHNSLLLTTMCLQYRPSVVACVCIHLACQWKGIEIPHSSDNKAWWHYVDDSVTPELLNDLAHEFVEIYESCPSRFRAKIDSKQQASTSDKSAAKKAPAEDEKKLSSHSAKHSTPSSSKSDGSLQAHSSMKNDFAKPPVKSSSSKHSSHNSGQKPPHKQPKPPFTPQQLAAATLSKPKPPKMPAPTHEGSSKEHSNHSQEPIVSYTGTDDTAKLKQKSGDAMSLEAYYKHKKAKQNEMLQQQQQLPQQATQHQHRHASKRPMSAADEHRSKKLKESLTEAQKKELYKRHLLKQQQQQPALLQQLPPLPPPLPKGSSGNSPPPPPPPLR